MMFFKSFAISTWSICFLWNGLDTRGIDTFPVLTLQSKALILCSEDN